MCFLDYSKYFNCVEQMKLWNALRKMGVLKYLFMKNLYPDQEASYEMETD